MRCRHHWETVAETFNPPGDRFDARCISQEFAEELAFGITTFTQRCRECGKVAVVTAIGDARTEREA